MAEQFKPLYDKILVRKDAEQTTIGMGVVIPDSATDKPERGTVLAVGHGRLLDNGQVVTMTVQPQDRVLFGKYAGTEIKLDGEEFLILHEVEVLGILVPVVAE